MIDLKYLGHTVHVVSAGSSSRGVKYLSYRWDNEPHSALQKANINHGWKTDRGICYYDRKTLHDIWKCVKTNDTERLTYLKLSMDIRQ